MPNILQMIGGIVILSCLVYVCYHQDGWQQLSFGNNVRSGPYNNIRVEQQNKEESGSLWKSISKLQTESSSIPRRRLNTTKDDEVENFLHHDVFEKRAGVRPQPRIVGGTPASPGSFPFYAKSVAGGDLLCGATLIWEDVLLSAAHCKGAFIGGVAIGGTKLDDSDATILEVESEYIHPAYDPVTQANDLMAIILKDRSTAPLVPLNADPTVPAIGDEVTTIGFGLTSDGGTDPSDVLRQVNVNIFDENTSCDILYSGYVKRNMLCAGTVEGGRDSCQGDSGGPLLTSDGVQIGIVSAGFGCGEPNVPSVYTDVRAYLGLIRPVVCALSKNPPPYCAPTSTPGTPTSTPIPIIAPTSTPIPIIAPTTVPAPTVTPPPVSKFPSPPTVPKQMMMMMRPKAQKAVKGMMATMSMQPKAAKQGMMTRQKTATNVFSILKGN